MKVQARKTERHEAILRIAGDKVVATQAELKRHLAAAGFPVDQATLSRDIRELGLVKVTGQDGEGSHYAMVTAPATAPSDDAVAMVARLARGADWSGNLVVVRTAAGNAGPLGLAMDRLKWEDVLGTIAGDDTLLLVVRDGGRARRVAERLKNIAHI